MKAEDCPRNMSPGYHFLHVEIFSEKPFTYGMILLAHKFSEDYHKVDYTCSNGAKIGFSNDYFVFELYSDS